MSKSLYIYNFHRVSNIVAPAYPPIPIKVFREVMSFLKKHYNIISQKDYLENNFTNSKKPFLIITFDDGFYDFKEDCLNVLTDLQIPVTLHIITDCVENGCTFWTQKLNDIIDCYYKQNLKIEIPELSYTAICKNKKEVEKTALNIYLSLLNNPNKEQIINNLAQPIIHNLIYTKNVKLGRH